MDATGACIDMYVLLTYVEACFCESAYTKGDPILLLYPTDSNGNLCGHGDRKWVTSLPGTFDNQQSTDTPPTYTRSCRAYRIRAPYQTYARNKLVINITAAFIPIKLMSAHIPHVNLEAVACVILDRCRSMLLIRQLLCIGYWSNSQ